MTHDYIRNGTTTLFAALDVAAGCAIGRCMQRHRHQKFIRFLNAIEGEVPAGKLIHVILDNYAAHNHPKVIEWLGHPRFTFHFTATSASWLNTVEGFFAELTKQRLKAWRVPFARIAPGGNQPLCRSGQRRPAPLSLDQGSRQNHRRRPTRAPSVGFDPPV
jgi:DDE superfamily endonuclease